MTERKVPYAGVYLDKHIDETGKSYIVLPHPHPERRIYINTQREASARLFFDLPSEIDNPENYIHDLIKQVKLSTAAKHLIAVILKNKGYTQKDLKEAVQQADPQHFENFDVLDPFEIQNSIMGAIVISRALNQTWEEITHSLEDDNNPVKDLQFTTASLPKEIPNRTHLMAQLASLVDLSSAQKYDVGLLYDISEKEKAWLYLFYKVKQAIDTLFKHGKSYDPLLNFATKKLTQLFNTNVEAAELFLRKGLGTSLITITEFERLIEETRTTAKVPKKVSTLDILQNSYYLLVRFAFFDQATFQLAIQEGMANKELRLNTAFFRLKKSHQNKWILTVVDPKYLQMQVNSSIVKTRCIALTPEEILNPKAERPEFQNSIEAIFKLYMKIRKVQTQRRAHKQ